MDPQKSNTIYVCDVCGKQFSKLHYLNQHLNTHSDEKPYSCPICNKSFLYNQSYKEHVKRHSKDKTVQCELCGKSFYNKRELKVHEKKHAQKGGFQCEVCDLYFEKESSLQAHCNRLHSSRYKCQFCMEIFSNKKEVKTHEFRQHRKQRKRKTNLAKITKMDCPLCEKVLCNKWRLESHLIFKHNLEKSAITERGLLHFRGRNCKKQCVGKAKTCNVEKNGSGNIRRARNQFTDAPGLDRIIEENNSVSCSKVTRTVSESRTSHRTSQNVEDIYDPSERTRLKNDTSEHSINDDVVHGEKKLALHSGEEYLEKNDCQKNGTGTKNQCLSEELEETTSDLNVCLDGSDKTLNGILRYVNDENVIKTCTLENVQETNRGNQIFEIEGSNQSTARNTVESVREVSEDMCKVTENEEKPDLRAPCIFTDDDTDSEKTCSVDLTEPDSLIDDVTDSYEVLRHEFDEIPDTAENDEVLNADKAIAVRPSSQALQEYFARYMYNGNVIERNDGTSSRLKAESFVQVGANICETSNNMPLNKLANDSRVLELAKSTDTDRNNPDSKNLSMRQLWLPGHSSKTINNFNDKYVCDEQVAPNCALTENEALHQKRIRSANEMVSANSDVSVSDKTFKSQGTLHHSNSVVRNEHINFQVPRVMDLRKHDEVPKKCSDLGKSDLVTHTGICFNMIASETNRNTVVSERVNRIPELMRFAESYRKTAEEATIGDKEHDSMRHTTISTNDPDTASLTRTQFTQSVLDVDVTKINSNNKTCFKYPLSPCRILERKRQPRLYSVQNTSSYRTKSDQKLVRHMPLSDEQGKEINERTIKNVVNNKLSDYNQGRDDRNVTCAIKADCNKKGSMQKSPIIFRAKGNSVTRQTTPPSATRHESNEAHENDINVSSQPNVVNKQLLVCPYISDVKEMRLGKVKETCVPRDVCLSTHSDEENVDKFEKYVEQTVKHTENLFKNPVTEDKSLDVNIRQEHCTCCAFHEDVPSIKAVENNKRNEKLQTNQDESSVSLQLEAIKCSIRDNVRTIPHSSEYSGFLNEIINMLQIENIRRNEKTSAK